MCFSVFWTLRFCCCVLLFLFSCPKNSFFNSHLFWSDFFFSFLSEGVSLPFAHAQHHPNPSHTSTRMAAAGSTPVEVLPQDDEPLLCHRSDGVLLTENNTGVIDLFNAVCCPVFLNTHSFQLLTHNCVVTLSNCNTQYDSQLHPELHDDETDKRLLHAPQHHNGTTSKQTLHVSKQ